MKKKQTIQTLIDFNKWRRGGEGEQPDPKTIGIAIDNAVHNLSLKESKYRDFEKSYQKQYEDTQDVLDAGVGELRFANMQIEILYNTLDEIVSMTSDPLTRKVAELSMERHQTDKLIHTRLLFK